MKWVYIQGFNKDLSDVMLNLGLDGKPIINLSSNGIIEPIEQ